MVFFIKQFIKMFTQHVIFPLAYMKNCRKPIVKQRVLFADEHKSSCPLSMQRLRDALAKEGYDIVDCFFDLKELSSVAGMKHMLQFMKEYAQAEFVVIQDNFLPVSSCRKRKGTTVIQLWHGCGAFKKFGYDAKDDIPRFYMGNVYKNYDLIPVSSPYCRRFFGSAMHVKEKGSIRAYGNSYTDCYFDVHYRESMIQKFNACYGEKQGRCVVVWAPTFRGNAGRQEGNANTIGEQWVDHLAENPDYLVIKSLHPHMLREEEQPVLTTGELLFMTDVLITDYSSVLFEYLLLDRPLVMFAPDLDSYRKTRGWYLEYEDLPGEIVTDGHQLEGAVKAAVQTDLYKEKRHAFRDKYMSCCDGNATKRLIQYIHETEETA